MLEKSMNDLRMKLVDFETRSYEGESGKGAFLAKRIREVKFPPVRYFNRQLENELLERERELSDKSRVDRNHEREIKALESELVQKEKARIKLEHDLQKSDEKNMKLKQIIDGMMSENTTPTKLGRFASTRSGK